MSQGWSVCQVSETTKQTGSVKSIFVPSFHLEKEKQWLMVNLLYEHYLNAKCVLQWHIVFLRLKAKMSLRKNLEKTSNDNLNEPIEKKSTLIPYAC